MNSWKIQYHEKSELTLLCLCGIYGITPEKIRSKSRKKPLPDIRCVLSNYLSLHGYRNKEIAEMLNRDHSTITTAIKRHESAMLFDKEYQKLNNKLIEFLNA